MAGMTDITSPAPDSEQGTAKMISGAVQYDDGDIVVKPQDGVKDPYKAADLSPKTAQKKQKKIVGEQPKVTVPGVTAQF